MNAFLTSPTSNPEDIQTAVDALQSRGILPVADNAKPRPDVFSARFPLVAARVKGRDVFALTAEDVIPSVKNNARRVYVLADGASVTDPGPLPFVCVKCEESTTPEDCEAALLSSQASALGV